MVMYADHFSAVAARYAAYRPHYPRALVDVLGAGDVAWDIGCGSGQLAVALAERFERVIATDLTQQQLDAAVPHPRVEYRRAPAEESGLADASVDLAVAAQAAHWFDWPRFIAEVGRVARPRPVALHPATARSRATRRAARTLPSRSSDRTGRRARARRRLSRSGAAVAGRRDARARDERRVDARRACRIRVLVVGNGAARRARRARCVEALCERLAATWPTRSAA
jgi:SAM-dependent methyltransferase